MVVTRGWRVGKVRPFAPIFASAKSGGSSGAVVAQFLVASPAVKGAGCAGGGGLYWPLLHLGTVLSTLSTGFDI